MRRRVCLDTGSSGIGRETAAALAGLGASIGLARRLREVSEQLTALSARYIAV